MGETCPCTDEYISSYQLTRTSTVPGDILQFDHSFGYNCKRLFNLCLIDPDVLVYSSGNLLHFYRISTKQLTFRRSASGGGIGFILKNPNPSYNYLTVAENGENPMVFIYKYPSMDIISILEDGALYSYTTCIYRQDGELLATQSGEPDYMITIWNWATSKILLRTKSFQNDVLNVIFSPYNPILLTTCGLTHIKFWKMARTFTGIKLQGDLGRFGKTEISDIYAVYPMYDETVISGCDWGNLLVWEAGLIKIEVCRKTRKPCHNGPVTVIVMDEDDIMTAALDGYVRIWFWETVELADPPEDDRFIEIEPIFEFFIGDKDSFCEIRALIKIKPDDKTDSHYYAQDGKGGIWFCDLNKDDTPLPAKKIFISHGGKVVAGDSSPISSHIATLGEEGRLHFYDYNKKELVFKETYPCCGSDILWLPTTIDSTGLVILIGFDDGVLRQICVQMKSNNTVIEKVHLIDVIKAHTKSITKLSINRQETILVTTSKDKTIFLYQIYKGNKREYIQLIPMGYVETSSIPLAIEWKNNENTLAMGCINGEIIELTNIPDEPRDTNVTYHLDTIGVKKFHFKSIKSLIRLQLKLDAKAKRYAEKKAAKLADLKKLQELNPGMVIDENIVIEDSEEETEEEPLYFPPIPNPIYWLHYTSADTIWISVGGYDAGYIYEIKFGTDKPVRSTIIADGDDIEIYSNLYIDKYLIWAIQGGMIRINAVKEEDFRDLSDYWIMGMHDNYFATVPKIFTNNDGKFLFTIGHDGNIFSYKWNGPQIPKLKSAEEGKFMRPLKIDDIIYSDHPSLEEQKVKAEKNRRLKISNEHKAKILEIVNNYRIDYEDILTQNSDIAPSQQFAQEELELDERITKDLIDTLKEELALIRRKLSFDVEKAKLGREKVIEYFVEPLENMQFSLKSIRRHNTVKSFKVHKLDPDIDNIKAEIDERIRNLKHVANDIEIIDIQRSLDLLVPQPPEEKFFLGYKPDSLIVKFNKQMQRLLFRYRSRRKHEMHRYVDWEKIKYKKPNPNKNHPSDDKAIRDAEQSIGDYKLKINADYVPPLTNIVLYKYKELLRAREELFNLRNNFNKKLLKLRDNKKNIYIFIEEKRKYLEKLHKQLPKVHQKQIPTFKSIIINLEYPEENLKELIKCGTGIEIENLMLPIDIDHDIHSKPKLITTVYEYRYNEENLENENFIFDEYEWKMLNIDNIEKLPDYNDLSSILENPIQLLDDNFEEFINEVQLNRNEQQVMSQWKIEKCFRWIIDKIVEQDCILNEIDDEINNFDIELKELGNTRLEIEKDAKFLEIYLLTLTEELGILRDCEELETNLMDKTDTAFQNRNRFMSLIVDASKLSGELRKSNDIMAEQIKTIQTNFLYNIKGTKFYDFLRRIFKKKYKPPKETKDDSESESESESSSSDEEEEGDEKSLESADVAPIRLEEDVCPPGCDTKLYELAFTLRSERHDLEKNIYAQNKLLDDEKKKIDDMTKQLRLVEQTFIIEKKNLLDFRLEKQKVLNQVETLILVTMNQMQYVKSDSDVNDIKNTLLFNSNIINTLHSRVGQLDIETLETKRVHRINIVHLQRMTTDCKHMHRQINVLEEDVRQAMCRKFGYVVDLNDLEESTLKRYIYDTQVCLTEVRSDIDKQVAIRKKTLALLEKELVREIQKNSEKLNILTVLQEEKNFLSDTLLYQKRLIEKTTGLKHIDFRPDIKRLSNIRQVQKAQIEFLEREIRTLRIKSKPLEVQPIEKVLNTSGLPGIINEDNQKLDESAFINLQSISYQFGPDVYTSDRIIKLVQKFALKHFRKLMSDDNVRKYSKKIAQYLGFVGKNFDFDQFDQITKCVIDNFENLVPKKYLIYVKPEDIQDLFKEIMTVFNYEKSEVNIDEVLNGIVANAIEITSHIKIMNVTQAILVEIYKEMIEVITIDDICKSTTLDKLCVLLLNYSHFNPRCINALLLVKDVMQHAKDNFIDEFTQTPVKNSVEQLIGKLMQKMKPEKPLEK